ncbi:MAG: flagellar motor protein MotB [Lachnospiraceae bacterium]|jgi:chemotaxis protein MotB|nr:flagellar motor protein MotB [Lachnospiraceae bacterium]
MAKKREEEPKKGAPEWQATFADLMNLLLCFFVLLFSMSTVDAQKFELIAASFSQTFSIFTAGSTTIGDGAMIGNGISQLPELDDFVNNVGQMAENTPEMEEMDDLQSEVQKEGLKQSEELAEKIEEAVQENNLTGDIEMQVTAQYVQLTMKGSLLFNSGSNELKEESKPVLDKVGVILERYAGGTIEIEGHTDNVPMSSRRFASNNELSAARALSVFNYLMDTTNLDPARIKNSGRGEYVPIADNSTEEGRAKNRRVEIRIFNEISSYE